MTEQTAVHDNTHEQRFELALNGGMAFADYRREGERIILPYVEASPELRGTGAAGRLMEGIMQIARREDRKVVPICGYAVSWMRRHEEYHDLLAK